jgi:GTP-binding protein EngB required for normal cell division
MNSTEYQNARKQLLEQIDKLRSLRDDLTSRDPIFVSELPADVRQKMLLLDRESTRLRNPDLTVAFVGGFSAGKSSLVNAFLGRYLLPEATKVTTAVPTFVRSHDGDEHAELHYLSDPEIDDLGELYRKEIADVFHMPQLVTAPYKSLLEQLKPLATSGRGARLVEQFEAYHNNRHRRQAGPRGCIVNTTIAEAQEQIRDETEAMFLDRVVLKIHNSSIPEDVVLVDLPGVSVPNPRHRDITFRFVRDEAHAVVFVIMATRLFDKDEIEIMDLFRSGESRIADKTFWVLNRWDSLSPQQQRQTIADFEAKMQEFTIPSGFQSFRTNALHGLLAQLGIANDSPSDLALASHVRDYEAALSVRYGGSHQTALRESQIPMLQEQVFGFLNNRLRQTTLRSAYDNAKTNFCDPLPHHLKRAKETDDSLISGDLKREEKELSHKTVQERFEQRAAEIRQQTKELRNDLAVKRSDVLRESTKDLVDQLKAMIENGMETDAFAIYQDIIAERELRKYPYHFEIEMRIVDNLNTMLKKNFRRIVRSQVDSVFEELARKVRDALEKVSEDVAYSAQVMSPFYDIISQEAKAFGDRVDGVVMTLAARLDELLLYKTGGFLGFGWDSNEILVGLEKAAKMGLESVKNPGQAVQAQDFSAKTQQIRQTLTEHYIGKVREYHEEITQGIFPIVINNMQQIESKIMEVMQSKYRPALEIVVAKEIEGEFVAKRKNVEERSRRFRDLIDQVEQILRDMAGVLGNSVK